MPAFTNWNCQTILLLAIVLLLFVIFALGLEPTRGAPVAGPVILP